MFERAEEFYSPEQLPGHTLRGSDHKDVGLIMGVGANYADVATGPLRLTGNLYVPLDAIAYCTDTHCYLRIPADQVTHKGWNILPEERPTPGPGEPNEVRIPYRSEESKQRHA
ncbi:MAG TPA: hypothetical protein VMW65_18625 [Chloroflexota bacterium]|nr:hypothetical protein [Chloroflexota bacterium]